MVMTLPGTVSTFGFSLLVLARVASAAQIDTAVCDGMCQEDASELYLLQKRARVVRKILGEPVSMLTSDVRITANKTVDEMCTLKVMHSKTSAFVTAVRGQVVPLSHQRRIAMLSTMEASGYSEPVNRAVIAACVLVLSLFAAATTVAIIIETKFQRVFKEIIQEGIETVSDEILCLDVTSGSTVVNVLKGSIMITDVKIANPTGWKTGCFFNANVVDIRLNLWNYVWKCFFFGNVTNVHVDSISFKEVAMNVERSASSSNVKDILDTAYGTEAKSERADTKKGKKDCKLTIHKMTIMNAGATVPLWGHIGLPTVHCQDFDKATEGKAKTLRPIVTEVLREFCQSGEKASEAVLAVGAGQPCH